MGGMEEHGEYDDHLVLPEINDTLSGDYTKKMYR